MLPSGGSTTTKSTFSTVFRPTPLVTRTKIVVGAALSGKGILPPQIEPPGSGGARSPRIGTGAPTATLPSGDGGGGSAPTKNSTLLIPESLSTQPMRISVVRPLTGGFIGSPAKKWTSFGGVSSKSMVETASFT